MIAVKQQGKILKKSCKDYHQFPALEFIIEKKNNLELFNYFKNIREWDGRKIGRNLLIWCEQGIGDQILYSSILNELINIKMKITVIVGNKLKTLFKESFPWISIITLNELKDFSSYDYQISIVSLHKYYRRRIQDFSKIISAVSNSAGNLSYKNAS